MTFNLPTDFLQACRVSTNIVMLFVLAKIIDKRMNMVEVLFFQEVGYIFYFPSIIGDALKPINQPKSISNGIDYNDWLN